MEMLVRSFVFMCVLAVSCHGLTTDSPVQAQPYIQNGMGLSGYLYYTQGQNLHLTCKPANPAHIYYEFEFYKDDRLVSRTYGNNYTIYNVQPSDSGKYTCRINHGSSSWKAPNSAIIYVRRYNGTTATPTTSKTALQPPYIQTQYGRSGDLHYHVGDRLTLTCKPPNPAHAIYYHEFWHNGSYVTTTYGNNYTIYKLDESHSGEWKCAVMWDNQTVTSWNWLRLHVTYRMSTTTPSMLVSAPQFIIPDGKSVYYEGESFLVKCQAKDDLPSYKYEIWKDGYLLSSLGYDNMYRINYMSKYDQGNYTCAVRWSGYRSMSWNHIYVTVYSDHKPTTSYPNAAPSIILHGDMPSFYEGATIHMTCQPPSHPGYYGHFEFFKDGRRIETMGAKDFYIVDAMEYHSGEYKCAERGAYNKTESWNTVYVKVMKYPDHSGGDYGSSATTSYIPSVCVFLITLLTSALM